jgi:tRNA-dihydrouridine synthase A
VHARKAVLGGLSPAENREVPPLRYDVVRDLKAAFPHLELELNGGLREVPDIVAALGWCNGVMLGREAYHRPYLLFELLQAEDKGAARPTESDLLLRMARYAQIELAAGERMSAIVRHMLGLFAQRPGAREFRRQLSEGARDSQADAGLLYQAAERATRLSA